jgi:hypothetical protein
MFKEIIEEFMLDKEPVDPKDLPLEIKTYENFVDVRSKNTIDPDTHAKKVYERFMFYPREEQQQDDVFTPWWRVDLGKERAMSMAVEYTRQATLDALYPERVQKRILKERKRVLLSKIERLRRQINELTKQVVELEI